MKILYLDWNSLNNRIILDAFNKKGYEVVSFDFVPYKDIKVSKEGTIALAGELLKTPYDYCFSFNYFPIAAMACKVSNTKYVSWTYDSPYVFLYSDTITFPTNYAFIFDSFEYLNLKNLGINTVYYLPLAADTAYYDSFVPTSDESLKYACDISMVGSMYSEKKHALFSKFDSLSDYASGYLEGLLTAQHGIYGADIMEGALLPEIVEELKVNAPLLKPADELETYEWVYSKYFLARELTGRERLDYLKALSEKIELNLYTYEPTPGLPKVKNLGFADYNREMPLIFKSSKINLNISLRSIVSGIPLRCFDILGCGGFLLSNYQPDFNGLFVPDEDFACFDSKDSLVERAEYYLSHEKERKEIARNGYEKVKSFHSYISRIDYIEQILYGEQL